MYLKRNGHKGMLFLTIFRFLTVQATSSSSRFNCPKCGFTTTEVPPRPRDVESIKSIIDDCESGAADLVDESFSREVSKDWYIESSLAIVKKYLKELNKKNADEMKSIFTYIYDEMGNDSRMLALFTSSAFHNTSYLTILRAASEEKYCSRGLLMVYGKDNYETLTSFSEGTDFVNYPDEVADQNENVVKATVRFFKFKMNGQYNFVNMMKALGPEEYVIYKNSGYVTKNSRWKRRENLYKMMMAVY